MSDVAPDPAIESVPSIAAIQALRAQLTPLIATDQALAIWDLGQQRSTLLISDGDVGHPTPVLHHMQVGMELLAQRTFKKSMPTQAQLEQGIMLVEDAIMPLARLLPANSLLLTHDPVLVSVAEHILGQPLTAHVAGQWTVLHRDAIEQLFQQLVHQAATPQIPLPHIQQSPHWAAALLLLREALHHWQVNSILVSIRGMHPLPADRG